MTLKTSVKPPQINVRYKSARKYTESSFKLGGVGIVRGRETWELIALGQPVHFSDHREQVTVGPYQGNGLAAKPLLNLTAEASHQDPRKESLLGSGTL